MRCATSPQPTPTTTQPRSSQPNPTSNAPQPYPLPLRQPQRFDDTFVCAKRTPLGACAEQVKAVKPAAPAPRAPVLEQTPEATAVPLAEESELIRGLLARSRENADANAREVREKTLKNSLSGQFGPFSKDAPVMKPDGAFEIVRISTLERYKDNKWVVTKSNGLNEWAPGFDKAAAEAAEAKKKAEKGKFLGIF